MVVFEVVVFKNVNTRITKDGIRYCIREQFIPREEMYVTATGENSFLCVLSRTSFSMATLKDDILYMYPGSKFEIRKIEEV